MDEVRKAVDELIFFCEEACERVKKSPDEDFTSGLPALSHEIKGLVRTLQENKVLRFAVEPFRVQREYLKDTDERRSRSSDILSIWICDPTGNQATETGLWSHDWTHERKAEVRKRWWLTPDKTRELRVRFLNSTESWVRFLRHKKEQLGTASPTLEAPLEGILTGEQPRRKTGRPKTKQLDQRQLKSILARLDKGETLKQVHKDYEKNIPNYHTFRRRVRPHLQNPYGKSKERR